MRVAPNGKTAQLPYFLQDGYEVLPGELLVMGKTHYYRGSFPMPWLSEGYYMAKENELYKAALAKGSSTDKHKMKNGKGFQQNISRQRATD